jgi:hypothetical protein
MNHRQEVLVDQVVVVLEKILVHLGMEALELLDKVTRAAQALTIVHIMVAVAEALVPQAQMQAQMQAMAATGLIFQSAEHQPGMQVAVVAALTDQLAAQ